ncbi:MAG: P-II family nitrogen regulator [Myxococcaceae bacterium]
MKMITAIIRPDRVDPVEQALREVLDEGDKFRLTLDHVEGHGRQEGEVEYVRGRPVRAPLVLKARITLCVNDAYLEKSIQAIVKAARTGEAGAVGDGKIFVVPLEECVRIRTGERGGAAI